MLFTIEEVLVNKIIFLDITIAKEEINIIFSVYRILTARDIIIPNGLCHPPEHKLAVIRYLTNGMLTYYIKHPEKESDIIIIIIIFLHGLGRLTCSGNDVLLKEKESDII